MNFSSKVLYSSIILACILFTIAVVYASWNGTTNRHDDNWYVKNMDHFVKTGKMDSNQIFPITIVKDRTAPPPFMHKIPTTIIVIPFIFAFGKWWGWIIAHIFYSLLTGFLISRIVLKLSDSQYRNYLSAATFILYIIFVNTIYVTSHALSEVSITACLVVFLYLFLFSKRSVVTVVLFGLLAALCTNSRSNLLVLSFLIGFTFLFDPEYSWKRRLAIFAIYFVSYYLSSKAISASLDKLQIGMLPIIFRPGQGDNMSHYFAINGEANTLIEVLKNSVTYLQYQFIGKSLQHFLFLFFPNLFIIWAITQIPRHEQAIVTRLKHFVILMIIGHLALIFVFQIQYRYIQIIYPAILAFFMVTFPFGKFKKYASIALVLYVLINIGAGGLYARKNNQEALESAKINSEYSQLLEKMDDDLNLITNCSPLVLANTCTDRNIILFRDQYNRQNIVDWVDRFNCGWGLIRSSDAFDALKETYQVILIDEQQIDSRTVYLYQFIKKQTPSIDDANAYEVDASSVGQ